MKLRFMWFLPLICSLSGFEQAPPSREYQLKAVFLFNFMQFVEWPGTVLEEQNTPITLGVLGEDPFGDILEETVSNELINGHPVVIKRFANVAEIDQCHLLFIAASEKERLPQTLDALKGRNTLTVGDLKDFAQSGGMIAFKMVQNKIKVQINLDMAREADLSISPKLLRLSQIVNTKRS
ncbi:MAG: YfiR family protein [Marinoscillum sp.]